MIIKVSHPSKAISPFIIYFLVAWNGQVTVSSTSMEPSLSLAEASIPQVLKLLKCRIKSLGLRSRNVGSQLNQWSSNLNIHMNEQRISLKYRTMDCDLLGLGWDLGFCISHKLLDDSSGACHRPQISAFCGSMNIIPKCDHASTPVPHSSFQVPHHLAKSFPGILKCTWDLF